MYVYETSSELVPGDTLVRYNECSSPVAVRKCLDHKGIMMQAVRKEALALFWKHVLGKVNGYSSPESRLPTEAVSQTAKIHNLLLTLGDG